MLGVYRLALSLIVMVSHLGQGPAVSHIGLFAVFGFYIVSGYLITYILNNTYAADNLGYWKNRFLRIYPPYFIVAGVTVICLYLTPDPKVFHSIWATSLRWQDWLGNIAIFPFAFYDERFRLVPPTWSVAAELVNYFFLWAFISRGRIFTAIALAAAAGWHIVSLYHGSPWPERYFPYYSATLPFSLGAMIYWVKDLEALRWSNRSYKIASCIFALLLIANAVITAIKGGTSAQSFNAFFYANMILMFMFIVVCSRIKATSSGRKWDKRIGDLAYPVFLVHWVSGYMVSVLVFHMTIIRGWTLIAATLPVVIVASMAIHWITHAAIEPLRDAVRARARTITSHEQYKTVAGVGSETPSPQAVESR